MLRRAKKSGQASVSPGSALAAVGTETERLHGVGEPRIPDHEVLRRIGRGSYGEVWLARNVMGTYRAVKIVHRSTFDSDLPYEREFSGIQRFEPLSRAHESQVDILHVGRNDEEGYFFYVMELADDAAEPSPASIVQTPKLADRGTGESRRGRGWQSGEAGRTPAPVPVGSPARINPDTYVPKTLKSVTQERGRLSCVECLRIGMALTTALEQLHRHGLSHRDIKPSNVIFVNGVPKLADIGLVASSDATRSFVGTEGYLPPEGSGSPQADLYSLGRVLYEVSTGKGGHDFPELPTHYDTVQEETASRELNEVILKACQPNARDRYESAGQMHADLALLQSGKSVRHLRWVERRLTVLTRLGLVSVGLVILASGAYVFQSHQSRQFQALASENRRLAEESQTRLVRLNVAAGERFLDEGDYFRALPWFAEALRLVRDRPAEVAIHQLRLEAVLKQCPRLLQLWFHAGRVNAAEFSLDGHKAVTASQDGTACVWDVDSGQPVTPPLRHPGEVLQAAFSPDSRRLLTVATDAARMWDASTGQRLATLDHKDLSQGAFSPDGGRIVTASRDGMVRLWDATTYEPVAPVLRHPAAVLCAAFSPDGQKLVTGSADGAARIWDLATGAMQLELKHIRGLRHTEFSPDGRRLATLDLAAFLWDARTGTNLTAFTQMDIQADHVTFSPNGDWVASSSIDGATRLCSAETGQLIHTLANDKSPVLESVFSPDSSLLLSRQSSGRLQVWTVQNGKAVWPSLRLGSSATAARFHPDGRRILTGGADGTVRLWDLAAEGLRLAPWPDGKTKVAGLPGPGNRLFTQNESGVLQIWDTKTWQTTRPAATFSKKVAQVFCPGGEDGSALIVEDRGSPIFWKGGPVALYRWDLVTGQCLHESDLAVTPMYNKHPYLLQFHPAGAQFAFAHTNCLVVWDRSKNAQRWHSAPHFPIPSWVINYSPDGRRLLINCRNLVHVFDSDLGAEVYPPLTNQFNVGWAEFSRDGRLILSVCKDGSKHAGEARVWDAATGKLLWSLPHDDGVIWAAFSPDGSKLATASEDRAARVWSLVNGRALMAPLRHEDRVGGVVFSPDGRMLATGSDDMSARLWDAATGEPITAPLRHPAQVIQILFPADPSYFMTATHEGFYLWNLKTCADPLQELLALAELRTGLHVHSSGDLEPLDSGTLSNSWETLRATFPKEFQFKQRDRDHPPALPGGRLHPPSPVPTRDPKAPPNLLDLSPHYNWTLGDTWPLGGPGTHLGKLPAGLQRLTGVDFDLRGVIFLSSTEVVKKTDRLHPREVSGIRVGQKCGWLHFLHSTGWLVPDGTVIGHYVLRYADGQQSEVPIVYGENTRGWYVSSDGSLKLKGARVAWSGMTGYGAPIRLFLFTLENPRPDVVVRSLDFRSAMTPSQPFLIAITVE